MFLHVCSLSSYISPTQLSDDIDVECFCVESFVWRWWQDQVFMSVKSNSNPHINNFILITSSPSGAPKPQARSVLWLFGFITTHCCWQLIHLQQAKTFTCLWQFKWKKKDPNAGLRGQDWGTQQNQSNQSGFKAVQEQALFALSTSGALEHGSAAAGFESSTLT